ncbi:melanoma antigen recognized by T-cells 1 [Tiliqua scincoides]|uniref:melanoma antigen recognized by T-cells 1 n=1 Tax=Tiliqua scincoides TaxID=71010 RepID=UPI00346195C2
MPRGQHYLDGDFGRGKGYPSLSAEEAAGIGVFVLVLAVLLIIGCWYYKRRSGYKSLLSKKFGVATLRTSEGQGALLMGSKLPLQEYNSNYNHVMPDAPPAYDKIPTSPLPPPYAP